MITLEQLDLIAGQKVNRPNANSVLSALEVYGQRYGLLLPHRLGQFIPQLLHESGRFRYDQEIWGPTPAQERYDTRTDLGNTPQKDGDGKKNKGRGPIQLTGGHNIRKFHAWCVAQALSPPDFITNPDLINTDPWEGLSAIWYWNEGNPTGISLNHYADEGNTEMITRKINGGLNGYADRLALVTRTGLVLLGYGPTEIRLFQKEAGTDYTGLIDGADGPKTRAAIHQKLLRLSPDVGGKASPVTTNIAVTPKELEKPVTETKGFWERIGQLGGLSAIAGFTWLGDWKVILALVGGLSVLTIIGLVFHARLVQAVKDVREAIND